MPSQFSIDIKVTPNREGIEVSGTTEGLKICLSKVNELIDSIHKDFVQIDKPGMKKFFKNEKGQSMLKATGENNSCIILPKEHRGVENNANQLEAEKDLRSCQELICSCVTQEEKKISVFKGDITKEIVDVIATGENNSCIILPKEHRGVENDANQLEAEKDLRSCQELICSYVTQEEKKISVFKGDITKEFVDVIVNSANGKLEHLGGLAGAIVEAGGKEIQDDCRQYVKSKGVVLEGHVMISTPGRLRCKKIVHVVGPQWNAEAKRLVDDGEETKQEGSLKLAVTNSLKEAMKYSSIAIPAISSGVFGFPRDLCAKVILDAVVDFCVKNPMCTLSDIRLINIDSPTVQAFEEEMKTRFGAQKNFKEREGHTSEPAFALKRKRPAFEMFKTQNQYHVTPQNIRIKVEPGDLAKEKVIKKDHILTCF